MRRLVIIITAGLGVLLMAACDSPRSDVQSDTPGFVIHDVDLSDTLRDAAPHDARVNDVKDTQDEGRVDAGPSDDADGHTDLSDTDANSITYAWTEPEADTVVGPAGARIAAEFASSDVSRAELYVRGERVHVTDHSPLNWHWVPGDIPTGPLDLTLTVLDAGGAEVSETREIRFTRECDADDCRPEVLGFRDIVNGDSLCGRPLIWPDIQGADGIVRTDFYLDGELIDSLDEPPWWTELDWLDTGAREHSVYVEVFDEAGMSAVEELTIVFTGEDCQWPPLVEIVSPLDGSFQEGLVDIHVVAVRSDGLRLSVGFDESILISGPMAEFRQTEPAPTSRGLVRVSASLRDADRTVVASDRVSFRTPETQIFGLREPHPGTVYSRDEGGVELTVHMSIAPVYVSAIAVYRRQLDEGVSLTEWEPTMDDTLVGTLDIEGDVDSDERVDDMRWYFPFDGLEDGRYLLAVEEGLGPPALRQRAWTEIILETPPTIRVLDPTPGEVITEDTFRAVVEITDDDPLVQLDVYRDDILVHSGAVSLAPHTTTQVELSLSPPRISSDGTGVFRFEVTDSHLSTSASVRLHFPTRSLGGNLEVCGYPCGHWVIPPPYVLRCRTPDYPPVVNFACGERMYLHAEDTRIRSRSIQINGNPPFLVEYTDSLQIPEAERSVIREGLNDMDIVTTWIDGRVMRSRLQFIAVNCDFDEDGYTDYHCGDLDCDPMDATFGRNDCGGCVRLGFDAGEPCGPCGSGRWECVTENHLACVGAGGLDLFNACGGCDDLTGDLGEACDTCGTPPCEETCASTNATACTSIPGSSFTRIPAGRFTMGDRRSEHGLTDVTLTRDFFIATHETTVDDVLALGLRLHPRSVAIVDDLSLPARMWYSAWALYANELSRAEGLPSCYDLSECRGGPIIEPCPASPRACVTWFDCGDLPVTTDSGSSYDCAGYRLPTAAEWEYAARAGSGGNSYAGHASTDELSDPCPEDPLRDAISVNGCNATLRGSTLPPGEKVPNAWGLYDVIGNASELVSVVEFHGDSVIDPDHSEHEMRFVSRGGSSSDVGTLLTVWRNGPEVDNSMPVGARLVRTAPESLPPCDLDDDGVLGSACGGPDCNDEDASIGANSCGGCDVLPAEPGASCGPCDGDIWYCDPVSGDLVCHFRERDVCGGCGPPDALVGDPCGACEAGVLACSGGERLVCLGGAEPETRNDCGGCSTLTNEPGSACGPCDLDSFVCNGAEGVMCPTYSMNACGGCSTLTETLGDTCSSCAGPSCAWLCEPEGVLACSAQPNPDFVWVPAGETAIGASEDDVLLPLSLPRVQAAVSLPFAIHRYEVHQALFESIMGFNPSDPDLQLGGAHPVNGANLYQALEFLNGWSISEGRSPCYILQRCDEDIEAADYACDVVRTNATCLGYRLPTSLEWEVAARANTLSTTFAGNPTESDYAESVDAVAWSASNSDGTLRRIGLLDASPNGLYDVFGNVAEWTMSPATSRTAYDRPTEAPYTEPLPELVAEHGVVIVRGGSILDEPTLMSAARIQTARAAVPARAIGIRAVLNAGLMEVP